MASFIYFYSKFTEEFLLLSAAAMFALLAVYCYHWVIKKRRLGAARNQVPAGMVKAYLNQLIQEAQFVRTQLFGLIANGETPENMAAFQNLLFKGPAPSSEFSSTDSSASSDAHASGASGGTIPSDLLERLRALESQLSEKESMVVNINVEKTKLLEEIDQMKQNEQAMQNAASSSNTDDLVKKIKSLEERLEEYSLFEDDLANLKRLQQENTQLKKRLEESGVAAAPLSSDEEPSVEPGVHSPESSFSEPSVHGESDEPILKEAAPFALDQNAIDSLLDGVTPTSPEKPETKLEAEAEVPAEPQVAAPAEPAPEPEAPSDEFEKLVDSVENSLESVVAAPAAEQSAENSAQKTDEELLKEFENLLNS